MTGDDQTFRVDFAGPGIVGRHELIAGRDFHLAEEEFAKALACALRPLDRDLCRLAMAVYAVDRLSRRLRRADGAGFTRQIELRIEVAEPDFWNDPATRTLISDALRQLSDDFWEVSFVQGRVVRDFQPPLGFQDRPVVALYSSGLDSAAGLASRMRASTAPVVTVTAVHQPGQRTRVPKQVGCLCRRYGVQTHPLLVRTTLVNPPRLSDQERSQRCRSFLFTALAGAAASVTGGSEVEIYESGVGALNLPLMAGMLVGGRVTRGCHPEFFRIMSRLVSRVAGRPIAYSLPFRNLTKAEMVHNLKSDGLDAVARSTVSCVHFPLRIQGPAKQCGYCPGCIGRRQALFVAGIDEGDTDYQFDAFGRADDANAIPEQKLDFLKATLMQVAELASLRDDGRSPDSFRRHVFNTHVIGRKEPVLPWVDVMRRHRDEWRGVVAEGARRGWNWARWLSGSTVAA